MTTKELTIRSIQYRKKILKYILGAKAGHTGGSLSSTDILNVLYNEVLNVSPENFKSPDRDRYVQSKGHCVEALYVVLADKGFFPEKDLNTLCKYKSHYIGHPTRKINGVEQSFTGYQDTVNLPPVPDGSPPSEVKIIIPFTSGVISGEFVYHCHIVQHADQGMMANIVVVDPSNPPDPPIQLCD